MTNSDKDLINGDGRQGNMRFFCMAHMRKKRVALMILLSFIGILTLVVMFTIYAAFRVYQEDSHHFTIDATLNPNIEKTAKLFREKRAFNNIKKLPENDLKHETKDKNMIKRNTDYENIENFLNDKYREINKNDASEEFSDEDTFIQKRDNSHFRNSIRKFEKAIDQNDDLVKSLILSLDDSAETAQMIAKDLDDVEAEINAMDDDIVGLLESAKLTDNSIHKRIRHKRETSHNIDPVAMKLYSPLLEEKKREKRLVQQKLAEVRDEFIRCKKSAPGENTTDCDRIYDRVMDRFREITKKFKEIEEIVDEMEHFNPSRSSIVGSDLEDSNERKKKDKKKKDKKKGKKSSEESKESSEEKKKKKSTTTEHSLVFTTTSELPTTTIIETTTEEQTTIDSTTIEAMTTFEPTADSAENEVFPDGNKRMRPKIEFSFSEPRKIIEITTISSTLLNTATDHTLHLPAAKTCPAKTEEARSHPKFQEDLDDNHNFFSEHDTLDDLVAKKIERNQRGPLDHFLEASEVIDGAKDFIEDTFDNKKHSVESEEVGKPQTSSKSSKNVDVGASGPFIALCEQMAKQSKQAQPQQQFEPHNNFAPVPVPLSGFTNSPFQFPSTFEQKSGSSKVVMNPGYNMMPYPVCFVNYPQHRMPQQQFYYPGLMPMTQPGGKIDDTNHDAIDPEFIRALNSGGYFVPSAPQNFRPVQVPMASPGVPQNHQSYRANEAQSEQPTYCTFLASESGNFPAHFEETTLQPTVKPEKVDDFFEPERSDKDRGNTFNIPTQFDIIYATYPNQMFAMNHSLESHHCNPGKLPCFGTSQCIAKSSWCDSKVDCLDSSDETACSCKARLAENRVCDGYIDCPLGSDELGCFGCDKFQHSCYSSRREFEQNGEVSSLMCYSSTEKCDGFSNCRNGKDETECSMIVKHFGAMMSYAVGHSEGILHRNFKGRWYPVCRHPNSWAIEACEMEVGKLELEPFLSVKVSQIPGPFIQPNADHDASDSQPSFSETCQLGKVETDENHAVFVKCPPPSCGISKLVEAKTQSLKKSSNSNSTRQYRDVDERIVGGIDAKSMEFPFIVAVYKDGHFHCGGSIYNENWIITAAHCTKSSESHYYEVWAGILRRSSYSPSAQIVKVSHVIRHPEYEQATMKNDIALMKVKHHLSFNRWVRPICLPSIGRTSNDDNWKFGPPAGTMCSTLGWGAIREKGPDPDDLKVVDVPIMSKCKYIHDQESESVCAGETFGTRDACQGDSGGPLVCKSLSNSAEWYLAGIVSHGEGCARANEPGVYTRVALYMDWINENTSPKLQLPSNLPRDNCPGHSCVWGGSKCIARSEKCDGFVDCLGGEDEIGCNLNWADLMVGTNATETEEPASNLTSIDPNKEQENVDETTKKTVIKKNIRPDPFRCTKISQIINMDQRCDRVFDCEDGTDEDNCTCRDHLKLAFAKLICDGHVDCADSTDEMGCLTCNSTEFACLHSKTCIDRSLHCDGKIDCKFREDELECLALTDGHSVMLDVNGKPFMHFKGFITQNIQSSWKILCDDTGEFHSNKSQIADDVCNVIGFKSAKSSKIVELTSSSINATTLDPTQQIDIRRQAMLRSIDEINWSDDKCSALEIECVPFQSNSFAIHPIQHENIKKNSTVPENVHHQKGHETIFVPINATDPSNVFFKPFNKTEKIHSWNHLLDFDWPWNAEIYSNGDLVANGILLDKSWVLVEKTCLGNDQEPLHENHVVALFGNSKSSFVIQSPYEQLANVDCLQFINDSNALLLHLESPIDFNRHVLPSFLPILNETEPDSRCLAIAMDSHQMTKSLMINASANCQNEKDLLCFHQAANLTEKVECDGETTHRTAAIVCKSKTSGWYPKAFHQLQKGFCDFLEPVSVVGLNKSNVYQQIHAIIDHPCEKCHHHAISIKCETHRCPLGKCLEKHQLCNGRRDCHDGSDEHEEVCSRIPEDQKLCSPSQFSCTNGKCVEKSKFCDHMNDCGDKSDEPSECTCFSYLRATDSTKICDGIRHCWDRLDENPVYCGTKCVEGLSFKCGNSAYCIPLEMVCDKRADCPNAADEQFCHGFYKYDTTGFGEVMQRSFGIWHTKCFPKDTPPTLEELEDLCKKLGFKKGTSTKAIGRISNLNELNSKMTAEGTPVEFQMFNATKVVTYTKFTAVKINDGFTVHLRPSKPLAKLISWDESDHEKCHRMELKCIDN